MAGVVVRGAEDGTGPTVGTRVVGVVDWECWAERVAVPSHLAAALPENVSFEEAASLPVAGITAVRAIRLGESLLGKRVLVTGATGGVGQFAMQLAAAAGADVTALVVGPEREAEARTYGAHEVATSLDDVGLGKFDLILDGIGGQVLSDSVHHLNPGGTAVTYGTLGGSAPLGLLDFPRGPSCKVVPALPRLSGGDPRRGSGCLGGPGGRRSGQTAAWPGPRLERHARGARRYTRAPGAGQGGAHSIVMVT